MPQEFQNEEESSQGKMDQSLQKVAWEGYDTQLRDSTFEFERKRNRPERYDRILAENTLKAIKKIDKARVEREARHHALRGRKPRSRERQQELEQSIHMVKAPTVLQQEPSLTLPKIKVKVSQQLEAENQPMEE